MNEQKLYSASRNDYNVILSKSKPSANQLFNSCYKQLMNINGCIHDVEMDKQQWIETCACEVFINRVESLNSHPQCYPTNFGPRVIQLRMQIQCVNKKGTDTILQYCSKISNLRIHIRLFNRKAIELTTKCFWHDDTFIKVDSIT